jgi:hypothetical protein
VADLKKKGDLAELKIASDLLARGHRLAIPFGRRKQYTAETIDWIAVYDRTSDRCYYVSANELGSGRTIIHLRLQEARNGQRQGIHFANDYESFPVSKLARPEMEPAGLEPATSRMQTGRSSN